MDDAIFLINEPGAGFIFQFAILGVAIFNFYRRRSSGYFVPVNFLGAFILFAFQALVSIFLAGFQLMDTEYYYVVQRLFSLPALVFLFLAYMKYPGQQVPPAYRNEKNAMFLILGGEFAFNVGWLIVLLISQVDVQIPLWVNIIRKTLIVLNLIWLAVLAYRRARDFRMQGESEIFMARSRWIFVAAACIAFVVVTRGWIPFSAAYHSMVSAYGWLILYVVIPLALLNPKENERLLIPHLSLAISLILLLILGLVTHLFYLSHVSSNQGISTAVELDGILRPLLLFEAALVAMLFLILPRMLRAILPDELVQIPPIALTPCQMDVMRMLADGSTNKQIAIKLNVTERTVKYHVTSLIKNLKKNNRYEIAQLARLMIEKHDL